MWGLYLSQLQSAPDHVTELGVLLEQIGTGELDLARAKELVADAGRLGAHPLGLFIADAVERRFGRARVIACIGDPFALMLTYAEAAKGDDALPELSAKAGDVLQRMQSVYGRSW